MRVFITKDEYKISKQHKSYKLSKSNKKHNYKLYSHQYKYKSININSVKNIKTIKTAKSKNIILTPSKNKKALLIGITYENTKFQLNGCINDIMLIKKILDKNGFTSTILSEKSDIKPTRENIINYLEEFLSNTKDGDHLYIHYSGHGSNILDTNNDEKDKKDETIVTSDFKHISDDEIYNIIKSKLNSKSTLFAVFDSCHSGSVLDLKYMYNPNTNKLENTNESKDELLPSVLLISGCKDEQFSQEVTTSNGSNGLLTQFLYANLDQIKNLSWIQLYNNLKNILYNIGASQIPQLSCSSIINLEEKIIL